MTRNLTYENLNRQIFAWSLLNINSRSNCNFFFLVATASQNSSCCVKVLIENLKLSGHPGAFPGWALEAQLTKEAGKGGTSLNKEVLWSPTTIVAEGWAILQVVTDGEMEAQKFEEERV